MWARQGQSMTDLLGSPGTNVGKTEIKTRTRREEKKERDPREEKKS